VQDVNKSVFVHDLFSQIANKYDSLNNLLTFSLHKLWKLKSIQLASIHINKLKSKEAKVLDLCTGTGDLAFIWAKHSKVKEIIGLDSCRPMLDVALNKLLKTNYRKKIKFMEGDALELSFEDSSFDAISVGFGLRNLSDLKRGVSEIYRVLKPNGIFVSLDLGHPEPEFLDNFYQNIFLKYVPLFGKLFAGNKFAYKYLKDSLKDWPTQKNLTKILWAAGFKRSYYKNIAFGAIAVLVAEK
jgi:demethylmenaquinone methyltransferase / 2-methoxy-6-polyprenyl-1,4-benzoquinol methylase